MISEQIQAKGYVEFELRDENGNVKQSGTSNTIVNIGKGYIAQRLLATGAPSAIGWIGVGTGATAVTATDTALVTALGARVASSAPAASTTTLTNDTISVATTFGAGVATGAITEAGLFNAATTTANDMIARTVFSVINKGAADTLTVTWKLQVL
jgi:hypothetical protein